MSNGGTRRASLPAKIAVVALATVAGLLVAEGLARWVGPEPGYGRLFSLGETPTRMVDGVTLWSDAQLRAGDDDLRRAAGSDAFTVVGLGDSIMHGVGLTKEETYLELTRKALSEKAERPVEILNLAVPGYNTLQEDAVHKELGERLQPDVVLLHFWGDDGRAYRVVGGYVVDVGDMSADGRLVVRALPLPAALNDFLLVHSRLYELITQVAVERDRRAASSDWQRVAEPLTALNQRVRAAGSRLVVLASPELGGDRAKPSGELAQLRQLGEAQGFEVIDLTDWLAGIDAATIRMDGCHFNAEGHRLVAQGLTDYLLTHDLRDH